MFFERHLANPAILLQPTPEDLGRVAKHIYRRVAGAKCPLMPEPPAEALTDWHRDYRAALNAFTFAVLNNLADFQKAKWPLPPSRAFAWVREKWLDKLDAPELQNTICLAAFGAEELEMLVRDEALPHPGKTEELLKLGLVSQTQCGQFGQYRQFGLREPGWGRLILAAIDTSVDDEKVRFDAAARHPIMAVVLSARLKRERLFGERERLWKSLAKERAKLDALLFGVQLLTVELLLQESRAANQAELTLFFWQTIESQPGRLANRVLGMPLHFVASFLDVAKQHGRDTTPLWKALESQPDKLAARAWETPLDFVGALLETAKRHRRDTKPLWDAIESQPDKLVARAWMTSLECVGSFLDVAKQQGRDTGPLWKALESQPDKLAASAWATSLEKAGSFLGVAKQHGRDTAPLWEVLESQPDKLTASMWTTPIHAAASFVETARQHGRNTESLWQILANEPDRLSQRGLTATLEELVGFAHYAPSSLLGIVLREIKLGHWNSTPASEGLAGTTWLAWECGNVKRDDLASDLITLLLQRANWRDFPAQNGGFGQACWLLANVPSTAARLADPFLKAVCTEKWLQISYAATGCGQLASGLRQVALHQSAERCRQFHHKGLGGRLNKGLAGFEMALPNDQSQIIQFLGCAGLCGWAVSQRSLAGIKPGSVSQLPLGVLPHRPEAAKVEDHQLQLWLGLRAFVSITKERLSLPRNTVEETLKLWRANLGETASTPGTAAHRINQSMVAWLETCLRMNPPALMPSKEPLWTLVGFPVRLGLPKWPAGIDFQATS